MRVLLLTLLVVCCLAEDCEVGEWSEWTEPSTSHHDPTINSCPGIDGRDTDRHNMLEIMQMKLDAKLEIQECRKDGTCPELNTRASEGNVDCIDGFAGNLECWNVNQLSYVNISDMFYNTSINDDPWANDNWGWTDPQTADEYVIQGLSVGTTFIRITDPSNPDIVGHLKTHGEGNALWRDMKVVGNYVYIVSEELNHGVQVFDLTRLRGVPGPVVFTEDAHYDDIGGCHNVVSNEETNFIYVVGCITGNYTRCRGGLHIVDVTDPLNPVFAGCYEEDGYVHDAECLIYRGPDANYFGRELCFCYNEDELTIVDVDDKSNMYMISNTSYDTYVYTHQGWLVDDQSVLLLDDELDEGGLRAPDNHTKTYLWDVRDLANPVLMNTYYSAQTVADHNQYIVGDLTFQANYEGGLRILSIDQANYELTEEAYFDTYPGPNGPEFHGAWNVYPYFPSGNLAVSDANYGLFILRPGYPAIKEAVANKDLYVERKRYRDILATDNVNKCPSLTQVERIKV